MSIIFICLFLCVTKSKSRRNICRVAWCRWDSFYPKKVFIHFPCRFSPSHWLRFYFPNSQGAQLIESMDGQMPRQFHSERGTGGSNQGSRLTCEAKSKIHYRIGKNQYLQRSREKKDHITFRKLEVVQKVKMNIRFPSAPTCLQAPRSEISMPRVSFCHSNVFSI